MPRMFLYLKYHPNSIRKYMEPSKVNTGVAQVLGSYWHFRFSLTGFVFLAQPCCRVAKFRNPAPGFWQEQLAFLWARTAYRRNAEHKSNETADFRQDSFPGFAKFIWNVQLLPRRACTHQMHLFANEEQHLGNGLYFFKKLGRGRIETRSKFPLTGSEFTLQLVQHTENQLEVILCFIN